MSPPAIRFLLDEHIAHAVAQALRRRGIEVLTAGDAHLLGEADREYLAYARAAGWVLVTHDGDFLRLHRGGEGHAGIVYCAQGTRTIGQIVMCLVLMHQLLRPSEMHGRIEFV